MQMIQAAFGVGIGIIFLMVLVWISKSESNTKDLAPIRVRIDETRRGVLPPANPEKVSLEPWEIFLGITILLSLAVFLISQLA